MDNVTTLSITFDQSGGKIRPVFEAFCPKIGQNLRPLSYAADFSARWKRKQGQYSNVPQAVSPVRTIPDINNLQYQTLSEHLFMNCVSTLPTLYIMFT
jgi:hypothetical protein